VLFPLLFHRGLTVAPRRVIRNPCPLRVRPLNVAWCTRAASAAAHQLQSAKSPTSLRAVMSATANKIGSPAWAGGNRANKAWSRGTEGEREREKGCTHTRQDTRMRTENAPREESGEGGTVTRGPYVTGFGVGELRVRVGLVIHHAPPHVVSSFGIGGFGFLLFGR
jgi:hypothetical protein